MSAARRKTKTSLSGVGKPIESDKSYIVAKLTKATQSSPRHPEFLPHTRQKVYGAQLVEKGITTTGEFWEQNPLDIYQTKTGEWWHLFVEMPDGMDDFYDKGQFAKQGKRKISSTDGDVARNDVPLVQLSSSSSLSDRIVGTLVNQSLTGRRGGDEMTALLVQKLQQDNDTMRDQMQALNTELSKMREQNQALQIAAGQFEVIKNAEIAAAVQRARQEQEKEDEEVYKQLLQEELSKKKGGLSDMMSDPAALANVAEKVTALMGLAMQLPTFIREMRQISTQQTANIPQQTVQYDSDGAMIPTGVTTNN